MISSRFMITSMCSADGGHSLAWLECLSTLIKVFPQIPGVCACSMVRALKCMFVCVIVFL